MQRKKIGYIAAILICLGISACGKKEQREDVSVIFNEQEIQFEENKGAYIGSDNIVMVPLETVAEELGADISIDQNKKTAIIDNYNHVIELEAEEKTFFVDGKEKKLSKSAELHGETFYAPLDALEDDFAVTVDFKEETKEVELVTKVNIVEEDLADMWIMSIRVQGQYEEIADYYPVLEEYAREYQTGSGMSLYYYQDYENGHDIEICIPVNQKVADITTTINGKEATIIGRNLEGGHFLSVTHQGSPDTLKYLWQQIEDYSTKQGLEIEIPSREIYLHEDLQDLRKQVTQILLKTV